MADDEEYIDEGEDGGVDIDALGIEVAEVEFNEEERRLEAERQRKLMMIKKVEDDAKRGRYWRVSL